MFRDFERLYFVVTCIGPLNFLVFMATMASLLVRKANEILSTAINSTYLPVNV